MLKKLTGLALLVLLNTTTLNAWPWSAKPVDRPIEARSKEELARSVDALKNELRTENYEILISSLSWLAFYEGTIVGVGGRYDPALGVRRACIIVHGKSTREVVEYAEKLTEQAPTVFAAYKRWVASGAR